MKKNRNTIWNIQNENGDQVHSLKDLAEVGTKRFVGYLSKKKKKKKHTHSRDPPHGLLLPQYGGPETK